MTRHARRAGSQSRHAPRRPRRLRRRFALRRLGSPATAQLEFCPRTPEGHLDIDASFDRQGGSGVDVPMVGDCPWSCSTPCRPSWANAFSRSRAAGRDGGRRSSDWRAEDSLGFETARRLHRAAAIDAIAAARESLGQTTIVSTRRRPASDVSSLAQHLRALSEPNRWLTSGGRRHHGLRSTCGDRRPGRNRSKLVVCVKRRRLGADESAG